jgi:hypothetical protein
MTTLSEAECLDPAKAFFSPYSLYHCYQFFSQNNDASDGGLIAINSTFGIMIGECIKQYCLQPDPALNGCLQPPYLGRTEWYRMDDDPYISFYAYDCYAINTALNADFSGPGVLLTW